MLASVDAKALNIRGVIRALVCSIYLGLVQTLLIGGALYIAALAIIARDQQVRRPTGGAVLLARSDA
jgi:hypothetical protein